MLKLENTWKTFEGTSMAISAFSHKYQIELDPYQLLTREGVIENTQTPITKDKADLSREFIRRDISCPECGAMNASIVSDTIGNRSGHYKNDAHFRFLDKGKDIIKGHRDTCSVIMPTPENHFNSFNFSEQSKNKTTSIVRDMVCKALAHEKLLSSDITNLREWIFAQTKSRSIKNDLNATQIENVVTLNRKLSNNVSEATQIPKKLLNEILDKSQFPLELRRISIPQSMSYSNTKNLYKKKYFVDVRHLLPFYLKIGELSLIIDRKYYDVERKKSQKYIECFLSLLLFKKNWDVGHAFDLFEEIHHLSFPEDYTLANIVGINPFQNYIEFYYLANLNEVALLIPSKDHWKPLFTSPVETK
jgi:hypothetical protein